MIWNDEQQLRTVLTDLLNMAQFQVKSVVIPVEELEAWLLSDERAIQAALRLHIRPKPIHRPEGVSSPKEYLAGIVRQCSKQRLTQYVNTVHNKMIAEALTPAKLSKCPSFGAYADFIGAAV